MKKTTPCRFPGFDPRTRRLEGIAFCGLALAGAALVVGALTNSWHFAQDHERAIHAWSRAGAAQPQFVRRAQELYLTNLTRSSVSHALVEWTESRESFCSDRQSEIQ